MKVTPMLKEWLVKNCDIEVDVDDDEFTKAAADALVGGDLTAEKYAELSKNDDDLEVDEFTKRFDRLANSIETLTKSIVKSESEKEEEEVEEEEEEEEVETPPKSTKPKTKGSSEMGKKIAGMGGTTGEVRVKAAVESYDRSRKGMVYPATTKAGRPHPLAGMIVSDCDRPIDTPSEADKALAGVWAKYQILCVTPKLAGSPDRAFEKLSEHEKSLLQTLAEDEAWDDSENDRTKSQKGYTGGLKALIDDSTSGGLEAAPIVFDDQVITTPLLYGELYPLVTTKTLDRGRRVEGVATGTVTASWGGVDDTAVSLFNTASYVSAFDTTIYRWEGAVRIGLDFLSDTPIDFGAHITGQYGERLLEDLDDVIAVGNGTNQPEGIINKSGTTSVNFGAATSIGNYESLRFGVAKSEHRPNVKASAVFCGTETSYQRVKALNVGTADARRLFAGGSTNVGTYDDYSIMQRPYKINESLSNQQIFYCIMARYRMYRRKGLAIRTSTEGDTLIRRNEMLIVAMARYGGQLERGACAAVTSTAPA